MKERQTRKSADHSVSTQLPCDQCPALCCRYYTVLIDPPEDEQDFDEIRWWMMHGRCWVWAEGDEWRLQVEEPCRYLGPGNECVIYDTRPQICREYGLPENREHPDEALCEYFDQVDHHEVELRTSKDVDACAARMLGRRKRPRALAETPRKARPDRASRSGRSPDCRP